MRRRFSVAWNKLDFFVYEDARPWGWRICYLSLEVQIDELEQYSKENSVELQGIPEDERESAFEIVKNVDKALNVQTTDNMMDACHKLGRKGDWRNSVPTFVNSTNQILWNSFGEEVKPEKSSSEN